jgi:hypothetical protein
VAGSGAAPACVASTGNSSVREGDGNQRLALDAIQRKRLEFLVRASSTSQKLAQRARIILLAAAGQPNAAIPRAVRAHAGV